ncbi:MAG: type VII secretion integral membrane protein EccD [Actinomycetota bacterium]|nr:type VII secretion integral membrane protein EccD [Actinomycetota bacterium]MDQ3900056.1 type VII secretion integral membrane protein EccD [Actinomycetota bacterium]
MTVVAPRTRIDLALPSDIAVANLLPMLLTMAGESSLDGGSKHGGWCLAKLGGDAVDPDRSLSSLGVLDGDLLQIRRRNDNPPPPLFDDVVEAIAEATPGSYRPWTEHTARTLGLIAAGLALLAGAAGLLRAGTLAGAGLGVGALAGVTAVVALVAGVVTARVYGETGAGVVVAAGSLPLGFVSGLYIVPGGGVHAENLLLACTLTLVLAAASIAMLGAGITPFVASATAAALGALTFLCASLVHRPAAGIAAAAAALALGAISASPRLTIHLSRLPMPQVPGNAKDLREDPGLPDYAAIERRVGRAHEYLTGMIIGSGLVAAIGAVLAAAGGVVGIVLGAVVAAVLLLRARSYANGNQVIALLVNGIITVGGLMAGLLATATQPGVLLAGFASLLVLATVALVTGVVVPRRRFSPVLRRAVDVVEAVLIASVLPLALGVLDLYRTVRAL